MIISPVFTNFIATESLKLDNAKLESFCQNARASLNGRTYSNDKGWQSPNIDLKTPELQDLLNEVSKSLAELHSHFKFRDTLRLAVWEAWININPKGAFNYSHNHPGAVFSCVYYVKSEPDMGNIVFRTPNIMQPFTITGEMVTSYDTFTMDEMEIAPRTGSLLIFPAWLVHFVRPNESDQDRISIALNCVLKKNMDLGF